MTSFLSDKKIVKSLIAGSVSVAIDKFYFGASNTKGMLILGSVVGVSTYISTLISPKYTISAYHTDVIDAKTIQERVLEIGMGIGGSFLINRYMDNLKSDFSIKDSLILFGGSSVISEYVSDYIFKEPLSYLS